MTAAHFQKFNDSANATDSAPRLLALRAELSRRGLDACIVQRADRHQNEYVAPGDERLRWLTAFTGSAGTAVVLKHEAALFVDGRYTLQARDEVDTSLFSIVHSGETPPHAWLANHLPEHAKLAYNPWLFTTDAAEKLSEACTKAGATLVAVEPDLIDGLWTDRPAEPLNPILLHDLRFAGEPAEEKLTRIRGELKRLKADALVVSDPHALAWAFNIRGSDVAHTPIPLAFAIIPAQGRPTLYIDQRKLTNKLNKALEPLGTVMPPAAFAADLAERAHAHATLCLDRATAAHALDRIIAHHGGKALRCADPIAALKAVKNETEIAGARAAHRRDGAALTRFLAWLDREAPSGTISEIDAVVALEEFRRATGALKDISFPTISGSGPNGAIVHYRVTEKTNRLLKPGDLFLIDSGGQYEDGTTDVTRTVAVGTPTAEMCERFTRVLKGHIAVASAVFPEGTTGAQLDSFARAALWAVGLDFDHGTGHGVGSYLSVHEGPARISKLGTVTLERGMIISNEPGYYKAGAYGIRIENLVLVTEAAPVCGAEKPLNAFETLTLAPIDRRLITPALLSPAEHVWLDAYHAHVRDTLSPLLDESACRWLAAATQPLG